MKKLISIAAVFLLVFSGCSKEELEIYPSSDVSKAKLKSYQSGTNNGYFWSLWTNDGSGYVNYTNGSGGNYAVSWNYTGNFTCGKGFSSGSTSYKIGYNLGAYTNNGGGTFGWYGWSRNPYYEYYVNETWGTESPHTGTYLGTLSSDGAGYNVYTRWVNNYNIDGGWGFRQIYSSRNWKISTGKNYVITFANHYNKWKSLGYTLGSLDIPAIMVTEGWGTNVSGYANCTIWQQ
jgi:endo-1,4-beta-xylanase